MIITIDENTRIETDEHNYMLQHKKKAKRATSPVAWRTDGYYQNMAQCVTDILSEAPRRSSELTSDLNGLIEMMKETERKVLEAINNLEK